MFFCGGRLLRSVGHDVHPESLHGTRGGRLARLGSDVAVAVLVFPVAGDFGGGQNFGLAGTEVEVANAGRDSCVTASNAQGSLWAVVAGPGCHSDRAG